MLYCTICSMYQVCVLNITLSALTRKQIKCNTKVKYFAIYKSAINYSFTDFHIKMTWSNYHPGYNIWFSMLSFRVDNLVHT